MLLSAYISEMCKFFPTRGQLSWPGEITDLILIGKREKERGHSATPCWLGIEKGKTVSTKGNFRVEMYSETCVFDLRDFWSL